MRAWEQLSLGKIGSGKLKEAINGQRCISRVARDLERIVEIMDILHEIIPVVFVDDRIEVHSEVSQALGEERRDRIGVCGGVRDAVGIIDPILVGLGFISHLKGRSRIIS